MTEANLETAVVKKCFVIMPISDCEGYPAGHFKEVFKDLITPAVEQAGYVCELATTTNSAHLIQLDVVTKVATADLCICDLSTNNPNVLFEYGIRQAFDKPTVLIKDKLTKRIFDLSGFRDIEYDPSLRHSQVVETRELITRAIQHTVDGRDDNSQIFSLVQLMKLTAASIPASELSPADAQMQMLIQKIDDLSSRIDANEQRERSKEKQQKVAEALLRSMPSKLNSSPTILGDYFAETPLTKSLIESEFDLIKNPFDKKV